MHNELKMIIEAGGEWLKPLFIEAMRDYFKGPKSDGRRVTVNPREQAPKAGKPSFDRRRGRRLITKLPGRCRCHGGMSTRPRSEAGRAKISGANLFHSSARSRNHDWPSLLPLRRRLPRQRASRAPVCFLRRHRAKTITSRAVRGK